ncbi:helix-turn-helix domain-containing protein [Aestuariivirga sp.]|jgi:transposase|uniref:helix-turn-helix domain-containing protein n=1 Tax=Aestuariivirga sp. TaxID=2650926 RepID=UPI003784DC64
MPAPVRLRTDYSAADLRQIAKASKDSNQSRRLLLLAAIVEGRSREEAARIGGRDRQTLSDWGCRFNKFGPDGRDAIDFWHYPKEVLLDLDDGLA